jgi:hypothetical protein
MKRRSRKMKSCKHDFVWNDYCGAYVCVECDQHASDPEGRQLFSQCFCGWSESNRYEVLEDDVDV